MSSLVIGSAEAREILQRDRRLAARESELAALKRERDEMEALPLWEVVIEERTRYTYKVRAETAQEAEDLALGTRGPALDGQVVCEDESDLWPEVTRAALVR